MHGRIMFINPASETGLIVGADRNRYQFALSNWEDDGLPVRNMEVSFATELHRALKVRPIDGRELTVDIFPETPAPNDPAAEEPEPRGQAPSPDDVARFRNRMQLDEAEDAGVSTQDSPGIPQPGPLEPGEILPELNPEPRSGKNRGAASPLFQVESEPRRTGSSLKYYAIGVAASAIVVAIAYLALHLQVS